MIIYSKNHTDILIHLNAPLAQPEISLQGIKKIVRATGHGPLLLFFPLLQNVKFFEPLIPHRLNSRRALPCFFTNLPAIIFFRFCGQLLAIPASGAYNLIGLAEGLVYPDINSLTVVDGNLWLGGAEPRGIIQVYNLETGVLDVIDLDVDQILARIGSANAAKLIPSDFQYREDIGTMETSTQWHLDQVRSRGLVSGGAADILRQAAEEGLDAYLTGEGANHHYHEAVESGCVLFLAGHYATETGGVKAVGRHLEEQFGLAAEFLDYPTGM